MNYKFLINGIKNIILDPVKAWESIDTENYPVKIVKESLFIPLVVLISISAITGSLVFVNSRLSPLYSIFAGIKCFGLFYLSVYASAFIFGEITRAFNLGQNFSSSFKLIVYSILPVLLCQVLSRLFESLLFVDVLGLYGLYIFWTGAEKILNPPEDKKVPLLIVTTISFIVVYAATNFILTKLVNIIFYAFFD
ncbi:MAG: YIP1 family protein [Bacteroidales bacterium]|nr:YIP1 family protein [Bacteroidales bacterium]